jgi:hypothetical protein
MLRGKGTYHGSVLLMTLLITIAIALMAYGVYDYALGTYRLSQRNEYRARAKALADSELEYVYFRVRSAMQLGTPANQVPNAVADICDIFPSHPEISVASQTPQPQLYPQTQRDPFASQFRNTVENWKVLRSLTYDNTTPGAFNVYNYFSIKIEVVATNPKLPFNISVRLGRHMNNYVTSIFGNNIFAQGPLEFAPSGNTVIEGDIAANGSIYIGTRVGDSTNPTLTIKGNVEYLPEPPPNSHVAGTFNNDHLADGTPLNAPTDKDGGTLTATSSQVAPMQEAVNLIGGLNPTDLALKYSANYWLNPDYTGLFGSITADPTIDPTNYSIQLDRATNLIYRSVIAPPPNAAYNAWTQGSNGTSFTSEYPAITNTGTLQGLADDPGIAALRAYNRADLIITVNGDGSTSIKNGIGDNTERATNYTGVITPTTMFDLREQKSVAITEINVATLKTKLDSVYPDFNGVLYVYLANSTAEHPAAVRLVNGDTTPNYASAGTSTSTGFSVITNGGIYVVGNYNTTTSNNQPLVNADGSSNAAAGAVNPAVLMGDAITILSSAWGFKSMQEDGTTPGVPTGDGLVNANHSPLATYGSRVATAGTTTIASGLLTGNITHDDNDNYVYSGGGHNLIRFLEDWYSNSSTANFYGSFGRLFESTQFVGSFQQPSTGVYRNPYNRFFSFNAGLKKSPPRAAPNITKYDRGTVFSWNRL